MAGITVITEALREEAKKWHELSDKIAPVKGNVQGLALAPTAFFIGDVNFGVYSQSYNGFQSFMEERIGEAAIEFEQIAQALIKMANAYDRADALIELDLNKIYSA